MRGSSAVAKSGRVRRMMIKGVRARRLAMRSVGTPASEILTYPSGRRKMERWTGEAARERILNEMPVEITYYDNEDNAVHTKEWKNESGESHRSPGPAFIEYYPNGSKKEGRWMLSGMYYRGTKGPVVVRYYENGNLLIREWRNKEGDLYRRSKPAFIEYYPNGGKRIEKWYTTKDIQDEDLYYDEIPPNNDAGPAEIEYYEDGALKKTTWRYGDLSGRYGEPTVVEYYPNGTTILSETWYEYDKIGREDDLPAVVTYYDDGAVKSNSWYFDGRLGREGDVLGRQSDKPSVVEFYPDGAVKSNSWYFDGRLERGYDDPAVVEFYPDGAVKSNSWYIRGRIERRGDVPSVIEYYPDGALKMRSWYMEGVLSRGGDQPAVEKYNEAGGVVERLWYEMGVYVGNTPPGAGAQAMDETVTPLDKNVSLFYESCQMNFEAASERADVDEDTKAKIVRYVLDPIIHLRGETIQRVLEFYDDVPRLVHDKNSTFRQLVFNERHTRFLTSVESLQPEMIDARLVVTQWVAWYYQHTLADARALISRLRDNIPKIHQYLPNVYKPELYADMFTDFFLGDVTINAISSPSDVNRFRELNFYLHAGDDSGYADRVVDKMMTGLRNYNYLHEWVDAKLSENDISALSRAGELCKIGKAGEGWMCGDGLFDTIPQLLSEAEGDVEWRVLDPDREKNEVLNLWSIGQTLMKTSGKRRADYPSGHRDEDFLNDLRDILWANKTFRVKWGYNDVERLNASLLPNGSVARVSGELGMDIVESIYDSLPE